MTLLTLIYSKVPISNLLTIEVCLDEQSDCEKTVLHHKSATLWYNFKKSLKYVISNNVIVSINNMFTTFEPITIYFCTFY